MKLPIYLVDNRLCAIDELGRCIPIQFPGFFGGGRRPGPQGPQGANGGGDCDPLEYTFFVAKNGNDTTGDGSACNPFLTIQKGIDEASAVASPLSPITIRPVVWVMPGTYSTPTITLKANVLVRGLGFNNTRVTSNWVLDATFVSPPSNDARSGWADIGIFGSVTADFNALNSNEGKLYSINARFGGAITLTSKSTINQFLFFGGEIFGPYIQNGMNVQFNGVTVQNSGTITLNFMVGGSNSFLQDGGIRANTTINGVGGTFNAFLKGNIDRGATLTLNGTGAMVNSGANALPIKSLISLIGGALETQITRVNDAFGEAYTPAVPGNWAIPRPTTVQEALDRMAANIPAITPIP